MRFLAFVDIHQDSDRLRALRDRAAQPDIDFVLCAGDFSTFGRGVRTVLETFSKLKKPFYVIPGNHEEGISGWENLMQEYPFCIDLHLQAKEVGNYVFLGYGGGGFAQSDERFRKIARQWYGEYNGRKIVMVTHGPPFSTALDLLQERNVGNKDYRAFILRIKPKLVISGHLHETAGAEDTIEKTKLINPGWKGKVIELK